MKIAIVCPYDFDQSGGVQTHIRDSAEEIIRLGHNVTVIYPGSKSKAGNINRKTFGKCKRIVFNNTQFEISIAYGNESKRLKTFLEEEQFDVIHYHTIWTPVLPFQVFYYSKTVNVATFHDTPPDNIAGKITRVVFYFTSYVLLRYLHATIAVSNVPSKHLARIKGKKILIIPPCINLQSYKSRNSSVQKSDTPLKILFLGRLDERKGVTILLAAYEKLVRNGLEVGLIIAGDGHKKREIQQYIELNNLDKVELTGSLTEKEKLDQFMNCDIFCSPALYGESFGIVLVEAMACSKPVIAAANEGYSQVLKDRAEDCLCDPGNIDDLFEKLKRVVQNSELRKKLGDWGQQESKKYDCKTVVPEILQAYKQAQSSKRDFSG